MLFEPSQKSISDFLGAASITCWLFAQFPQVIENYRLGSCKGLALPFLVNWLLGDFTNLIGCVFTDQLPFQTYLATYFTFVDFILIVQFWYYGRKHKHRLRHAHHHHTHSHPTSRQGSQYLYHSGPRTRTSTSRTRSIQNNPSMTASFIASNGDMHAAYPKPTRLNSGDSIPNFVRFQDPSQHAAVTAFPPQPSPSHEEYDNGASDNEEIDGLPEMAESTLSQKSDASSSTIGALQRGRSIYRPSTSASAPDVRTMGVDEAGAAGPNWRQLSGSRTRGVTGPPRERPSQSRTRSVVFLSIWTMVGLGGLYRRSTTAIPGSIVEAAWKVNSTALQIPDHPIAAHLQEGMPPPSIDYSLLVGRVAAWMCVCFYLTSRMPQIWKNFRRRSVEGLSILLFAAAFMGNLFYVLSILSSPSVQEDEGYLFESVPFLLGSGGTLIFDLTIMGQACMYAGLAPKSHDRIDYQRGEESSGLLARDSQTTLNEDLERRDE